jgi:hypothetical protein
MGWVDTYLNQPSVKAELGVSPEREFTTCNMDVNQAFTFSGDWSNSALLLPELVNGGVRLLVYAGNAGEFFPRLFFGLYSAFNIVVRTTLVMCCAIDGSQIGWRWAFLFFCPVLHGMVARSLRKSFWRLAAFCAGS